jgi:hypothetical protein
VPAQLRRPAFQFMIPLSTSPAHDVVSHVLRHTAITWTAQGSVQKVPLLSGAADKGITHPGGHMASERYGGNVDTVLTLGTFQHLAGGGRRESIADLMSVATCYNRRHAARQRH